MLSAPQNKRAPSPRQQKPMRRRTIVGAAAAAVALAAAIATAALRKHRKAQRAAATKPRRPRGAGARAHAATLSTQPSEQQDGLMAAAGAGATTVVPRYSALRSRAADEVSILCWNALSAALARQNALPWASVTALSWEHRAPLIQAELRATSADVICLQEVDGSKFEEMQSWLPGYQSLLQDCSSMKTDSNGRKDRMLLAFFWKPRFQLVWADHRSRTLLAQLRDTSAPADAPGGRPRDLWLVNMHLEGHPLRPHDRINQLRSALTKLTARLAGTERRHPAAANVIVVGDFNSGDKEGAAYALLRDGRLAAGVTEHEIEVTKTDVTHAFQLRDVYQASNCPLPFTRKAPGLPANIDFIFACKHMDVASLYHPLIGTRPASAALSTAAAHCTADQSSTTHDQTSKQQADSSNSKALAACTGRALAQSLQPRHAGMPNLLCPSDHLPLGVVLRWRAQEEGVEGEGGPMSLSASQAHLLVSESTPAMSTTGAASSGEEDEQQAGAAGLANGRRQQGRGSTASLSSAADASAGAAGLPEGGGGQGGAAVAAADAAGSNGAHAVVAGTA